MYVCIRLFPHTLSGVLHLEESVGAGRLPVGEGGDGYRGHDAPPLALLHLHPHFLQQLVVQSVGHVKLTTGEGNRGGKREDNVKNNTQEKLKKEEKKKKKEKDTQKR